MGYPADTEHARRRAVAAELTRLVTEAITVEGGRVTPEGLVVMPGRPRDWAFDEKLTLCVVNPDRVDFHMRPITDPAFRAKAMMFIDQFAFDRRRCDDLATAVLVFVPEHRL